VLFQRSYGTTPMWASFPHAVITLALFWPRSPERAARRLFAAATAGQGEALGVALLSWGVAAGPAAWMSLVHVAVAIAVLAAWRRLNSAADWAPGNATDTVQLVVLCWTAAPALLLAGGMVGPPATPDGVAGMILWDVRILVSNTLGIPACLLLIVDDRRFVLKHRPHRSDAVGVLLSLACLFAPFLVRDYPVAWLVFVPGVWVALRYPPRSVAVLCQVGALASVIGSYRGVWSVENGTWMPSDSILGIALAAVTGVAWLIVYQREDTARRTEDVQVRRRSARAQNMLLEGVLTVMTDGVLLADETGALRLANPAARALLGPTLPADIRPQTWAGAGRVHGVRAARSRTFRARAARARRGPHGHPPRAGPGRPPRPDPHAHRAARDLPRRRAPARAPARQHRGEGATATAGGLRGRGGARPQESAGGARVVDRVGAAQSPRG
jgi:PAS domain-containing protein